MLHIQSILTPKNIQSSLCLQCGINFSSRNLCQKAHSIVITRLQATVAACSLTYSLITPHHSVFSTKPQVSRDQNLHGLSPATRDTFKCLTVA